ncbi:hypothetical protein Mapa_007442 [Marchantia paleacea]|nr:hypothetical protein Mapa_007442 [Marchantia paleacea]
MTPIPGSIPDIMLEPMPGIIPAAIPIEPRDTAFAPLAWSASFCKAPHKLPTVRICPSVY